MEGWRTAARYNRAERRRIWNMTGENAMKGTLEGIRVLDLARVLSGPHCSMILGDLGAEVIKIEKPGEGDMVRANYPRVNGTATYFYAHNRNKKSVTLNFRKPGAKEIFLKMVADADVVVENYRAGTMEAMGLGYDVLKAVNPRIILTRISGFGQDGPYSNRTCFDGAAQAMSGLMDITGPEDGSPTMMGTYVVDYATGLYAVIGTLAALHARERSGVGQVVDVALLDAAVSMMHTAVPDYLNLGEVFTRKGNNDRYAWPSNVYEARDGRWAYIHSGMDNTFAAMMKIIGREDLIRDARTATREARSTLESRDLCEGLIGAWVKQRDADEVIEIVSGQGIPCAKVSNVPEMVENEQVKHRNMIQRVAIEGGEDVYLSGPVIHFSEDKCEIHQAPPKLGEHTDSVLARYGYSAEEIQEMRERGII